MSKQKRSHIGGDWFCTAPGTVVSSSEGLHLATLIESLDLSVLCGIPADCLIRQITVDSRNVNSGSLFIALSGSRRDGHDFIDQAVNSHCSALLVDKGCVLPDTYASSGICVLEATDTRKVFAALAETIFAFPAQDMTMLAVTGTNGKTTVTYLLESILRQAGKQPGVLGTINYRHYTSQGEVKEFPSPFTTPEPLLLQETLRKMAESGVDTVIMEVSSHGLEQNRIGNLFFDVAAFTNLSRDHLDYHRDMEAYFTAKALLFSRHLRDEGTAVITCGDETSATWSERLLQICLEDGHSVVSCGNQSACNIYPLAVTGTLQETEVRLQTPEGICSFTSPLVGDFNVTNLQISFAMAFALGLPSSTICTALSAASGAPGRMQRIAACPGEQNFRPTVFVDYAHTPDALKQVLTTLKALPHTVLYSVFGCGGDRDAGKRPLMGEIAGRYADVAILTEDNPRSEDSLAILASVSKGLKKTDLVQQDQSWLDKRKADDRGFVVIPDRHQAIHAAIAAAGSGDIVLIAGKGHEDYQITCNGKKFFDDSLEAADALHGWTLESLILATRGQLAGGLEADKPFGAINTDSRTIQQDDIFLALKGERFDAHDYVGQVVDAGAGCLILERVPEPSPAVPVVIVKDTETALGDLASYRRSCLKEVSKPQVAAITGSSGKTTVKEMCAAIFSQQWPERIDAAPERVLKTEGNFNNLIGLPLSLLPASAKHKAVILEMGMSRPGEIARLTEIADPDIACILNVHGAHLQGLGNIEGVAKAKGELFQGCGKGTVLVVNSDDFRVVDLAEKYEQKKIFFGLSRDDSAVRDVYAAALKTGSLEQVTFTLHVQEQEALVALQVPGAHNISNALAAAAIAHAADIDIALIAKGLSAFVPTDRRMQVLDGPAGSRIINDTYNANPESMKAGLTTLCELGSETHIAVLGDMLELGPDSHALHRKIGAHAADSGVEYLGLVGDFAASTAAGAMEQGLAQECVRVFAEKDECLSWLHELVAAGNIQAGSYILVKGSRGMRLEDVVEEFIEKQ
ncbi:MAG: UDP-N-acetylmuramoyl-L-alanyl-D-glutamate--2,6-diaminopimelate ligase [Thermodesulfobacteriota bacterium]|nr:UDP-N-acetylmuramoyl-L-alanyl-D-glutamate--2,6-diaminopimelate ligase [Thermodesulfobacteriota bacterium]